MVSSGRQMLVCIVLLLSAVASANAQLADKSSTSTISGKVTIGGKGVSGMVVGLATATASSTTHITGLKAVTDEEGNYRINNVPPGAYQVIAAAPAYVLSERRTPVIIGKNEVIENIDIGLVRGGVITGKVTDAEGRPLIEEEIFFSLTTPGRGLPYMERVRTDDRGVYRAFGLPAGRYIVSAGKDSSSSYGRAKPGLQRTYHPSAANAADATVIEVNEGSESLNVEITLGRQLDKYVARGRIIDGDTSQPLPNTGIGIQLFFGAGGITSRGTAVESTKDGEFEIENLPPGEYAVYLESPTHSELFSQAVRFEVIDQDVEGLLIKASKGGSASGVVVFEGTFDPTVRPNLAEVRIFAFVSNEYDGRKMPSANINPDGIFRLTGLAAGQLRLHLSQTRDRLRLLRIERDGVAYPRGIEIQEGEQITGLRVVVSQANGTIRGLLKLPAGLQLPESARLFVSVRRIEDPTVFIQTIQADARGQFVVEGLVAGTYGFNVDVVGVPNNQRPRIPRPTQTVVVNNGAIADVTITVQMPATGPSGP